MSDEPNRDRWQQLVSVHEDLDHVETVLPMRISGIDGSRIESSPRAIRFAEALAFNARWSGISDARRRYDDLAA
jgi:hypothetical protein